VINKKFYDFLGPRLKKYIAADFICGIGWFIVESSFILILQGFLKSLGLIQGEIDTLPSWYPTTFEMNVIFLLVFGVVRTSLLMAKNYLSYFSAQVFIFEKREEILRKAILGRNTISHEQILASFGETVAYGSNYVVHVCNFIYNLTVTTLFTFVCFYVAPKETSFGVLLLAIMFLPIKKLAKKVNSHGEELQRNWRISHKILTNSLKNIFYLRLHGMLQEEAEKGRDALKSYERNYHHYSFNSSFVLGLPQFIGIVILCATAYLSVYYFNTTAAVLLSFFYLFIRFSQSASQTSHSFSYLKLTKPGFEQLFSVIDSLNRETDKKASLSPRLEKITLECKNLTCGYDNKPVLKNINLKVSPSELLLIKGASGVGKSTLLRTILGETEPLSGNIIVNGSNELSPRNIIKSLGYVGPEPFLVYDTVKENLLYGNDHKIADSELWLALEKVGLKTQVENFSKKLEEVLLDETQLSSGQKQRLSFARALLRKPALLILDEATANIDSETEEKILKVLTEIKPNLSIIAVSHKQSFDSISDFLINL
jgi:ABC-type multidrug transport system fused ATPase/permease subunit